MKFTTKYLVLSAMFIVLGLVLPFATGQVPLVGKMLLPMHIPVLLCGLICGWQYGFIVGIITPLLRSLLFSMPVLFPNALAMSFELATYGLVVGFIYNLFKKKSVLSIYLALIVSMIFGRIVWGVVMSIILGGKGFTFGAFLSGALFDSILGIILQLILIPLIMVLLDKIRVVKFDKEK